jgi:hypothetical protein
MLLEKENVILAKQATIWIPRNVLLVMLEHIQLLVPMIPLIAKLVIAAASPVVLPEKLLVSAVLRERL